MIDHNGFETKFNVSQVFGNCEDLVDAIVKDSIISQVDVALEMLGENKSSDVSVKTVHECLNKETLKNNAKEYVMNCVLKDLETLIERRFNDIDFKTQVYSLNYNDEEELNDVQVYVNFV